MSTALEPAERTAWLEAELARRVVAVRSDEGAPEDQVSRFLERRIELEGADHLRTRPRKAMEAPVQVTFRGVPATHETERVCLREAQKLARYHPRITACNVQISQPHRRHHKGNLYDIRIKVLIPRGALVVDRTPPEHASDEKLGLAIREAFDAARRRLEDAARIRRGAIKHHGPHARGR